MIGVSSFGINGGNDGLSVPGVPGTWGNIPSLRFPKLIPLDFKMLVDGGGVGARVSPFFWMVFVSSCF